MIIKSLISSDIVPWNLLLKTTYTNLAHGWDQANIDEITVKLGDFGSALHFNQRGMYFTNPRGGCTDYLAPEIKSTLREMPRPYSHQADIYSAAMCLKELFTKGITQYTVWMYEYFVLNKAALTHQIS